MMFKRKRKVLLDEEQAAEFYRRLAAYYEAVAKLPPNWREVAEGRVKLPATWGEYRAELGDAFASPLAPSGGM